jgi:hypothetical protein
VPWQLEPSYLGDWIGLRTLNEDGRLLHGSVPCGHQDVPREVCGICICLLSLWYLVSHIGLVSCSYRLTLLHMIEHFPTTSLSDLPQLFICAVQAPAQQHPPRSLGQGTGAHPPTHPTPSQAREDAGLVLPCGAHCQLAAARPCRSSAAAGSPQVLAAQRPVYVYSAALNN